MGGCSCVSPHRGMKRKGLFEIQWWTFGIERVCGGWFLIKSGLEGCGNGSNSSWGLLGGWPYIKADAEDMG